MNTVNRNRFRTTVKIPGLIIVAGIAGMLVSSTGAAGKFNRQLDAGDKAPGWTNLIGTDDHRHSLSDYADAKVIVFTFICNHCPVAKAYEDRFIEFAKQYKDKQVTFVAVNCSTFPADRLDKMKQRAKKKGFNFDYLYDPSQKVGRAYGATVTPQVFVLDEDRKIAYMGAFDDNRNRDKVKYHYVRDAVNALLTGKAPEVAESRPFGCEINYSSN